MSGEAAGRGPAGTRQVYADHAATSWPKPASVVRAMAEFLEQAGGNPGRSGHRLAVAAARAVYAARRQVARLLGVEDESRIVFGPNATWALNLALYGLLGAGDRVVTSGLEHNAVARPLFDLGRRGVRVARVRCTPRGELDLDDLRRLLRRAARTGGAGGPGGRPGSTGSGRRRTCLVVLTHASNVTGGILPVEEAARLAHEYGALVLVDAAQSAGHLPLDVPRMGADLLAFTGHKGLLGPPGTGGLYIGEGLAPRPLVRGGTGSFSHLEEQPQELPDLCESGTLNGVGLAGLGAAVEYLARTGVECIRRHELGLTRRLLDGLADIPGVEVYGPGDAAARTAVVSFNIRTGSARPEAGAAGGDGVLDPALVARWLESGFGVMVRAGLHCAPWAHRTIGTYPHGAVRVSLGCTSTAEDVDWILHAVRAIAAGRGRFPA